MGNHVNVAEPRLAAHLDRCWDAYRKGMLAELIALLPPCREVMARVHDLDPQSRGNAEVELDMLTVTVTMVAGAHPTECLRVAAELVDRVATADAHCDGVHRLAAFASGVHAAMRVAKLSTAEKRFQLALAEARGLTAEDGEAGVSLDDVCAVLGGAGLHLAGAAAAGGDFRTTLALLEHSALTAAELGREHYVLGQYFGPEHVAATRCICLVSLQKYDEALEVGRGVTAGALIPLLHATLFRAMAEAADRLERRGAADVLRDQAERVAPSLARQFGRDLHPPS